LLGEESAGVLRLITSTLQRKKTR